MKIKFFEKWKEKKEEKNKLQIEREKEIKREEEENRLYGHLPKCKYCGTRIKPHEQIKTFSKDKFHVKCFRFQLKVAKREALNGQFGNQLQAIISSNKA